MNLIKRYFDLNDQQEERFSRLFDLYVDWNSRINLVSRKDFEHFYERHVLHSLAIAKLDLLIDSKVILDLGTGGGFRVYHWLFFIRAKDSFYVTLFERK